ncbi:MAG: hypothetical protein ACK4HV_08615, partial [Parachlamydiaceae bacterium]
MTKRISHFPLIESHACYDVNKKNELYQVSLLGRIWTYFSRGENERIRRIQHYCDALLSQFEKEALSINDFDQVKRIYEQLKLKVSPELYALKAPFDRCKNADITEWLNKAACWKKEQECLDDREISASDKARIKNGASFKGFSELMQDEAYRHEFFTWTLRYRLPAELFLCFPGLKKKLAESFLH